MVVHSIKFTHSYPGNTTRDEYSSNSSSTNLVQPRHISSEIQLYLLGEQLVANLLCYKCISGDPPGPNRINIAMSQQKK